MALTVRAVIFQIAPVVMTAVLLAISLTILNISTRNPNEADGMISWLVPLNAVILVMLVFLILFNLYQAIIRLRTQQAGSRFTLRLMLAFSVLTFLPVMVVSYFSLNFLGDRIDSWFDVKIESALDDSLELARRSLEVRMRQHLRDVRQVAGELARADPLDYSAMIEKRASQLAAHEMVLFGKNRRVLVYSGDNTEVGTLIPHFPSEDLSRQLSSRGYMARLEHIDSNNLYSRVAITLRSSPVSEPLVLTALFPFSEEERRLAGNVEDARSQYRNIDYQRDLIKTSFRVTLFMVMVLATLFALWAAFVYSRRLTEPVRKLLEGTLAVASGNLDKKLPVSDRDDFSLLARSFNTMTTRLSDAREESERSQQQVQRQRDYLNAVMDNLTSGVITFDERRIIRRVNTAAEQLLQMPLENYLHHNLADLQTANPALQPLMEALEPCLQSEGEWQTEVSLNLAEGRQILVCRGAALPQLLDGSRGHVLVLDDITDVIQAEHEAAWSEVARRLAHEIKNPLTPIRLSAERLQHRLAPQLDEPSAELLQRMTRTIMGQVDNLKAMVDAFSDYARAPAVKLQTVDLNVLLNEVVELYEANDQDIEVVVALTDIPPLQLDVGRIRQLIVNLMKNAFEALSEAESVRRVQLSTVLTDNSEVHMEIADTGRGIPEDLLPRLFDPYVTSKQKGSGLGLSIVKKIVEEHSARIVARANEPSGASMNVYFPLTPAETTINNNSSESGSRRNDR